ncbi:MAG TPA: prepilin-type N-terminal cleavage/methylation domain-containing protein [Sumerlaeia bacterium]|nr:prepilin-type N-terminal cleavage/methylation domain-containing protein [Sumerlaeia bacterium]
MSVPVECPVKKGFTLIELLIVVAIIAILAAIAVPNFLEAQVRSKVSRVKADMAALATAIEAYTVDHGKPVPGITHWQTWFPEQPRLNCLNLATTPIAYITTLPEDPFLTAESMAALDPSAYTFFRKKTFIYYAFFPVGGGHAYDNDLYPTLRNKGFMWVLNSPGPEKVFVDPWVDWQLAYPARTYSSGRDGWGNLYDSTNGTRSAGRILRTNKGPVTGVDLTP